MACAECFFLISAKTRTFSAPIVRRYRKSDPAVDSIRPSSATWARTTLPACGTYRSSEPTARTLSHQRSILSRLSRHCGSSVKNPFRRGGVARIASLHLAASLRSKARTSLLLFLFVSQTCALT
jgi:hypothetical protein